MMQSLGKKFMLYDGFFTTLIPSDNSYAYALEAKVNDTGQRVEKALGDEEKLHEVLNSIAEETANAIKKLPKAPVKVTVDGGITRSEYLIQVQVTKHSCKKTSNF